DPESTGDTNLHAPLNPSRKWADLSHITFCYDVEQEPDYELTKTADAESVNAGDPVGFTITLTNTGPVPLTDATISDQLPLTGGLDWNEDPDNPDCDIDASNLLTCDFGEVEVGGERSVHVTAVTNAQACGVL